MQRPILIATIGYIIGIIMGLYFEISIVFFYIILLTIFAIFKYIKNKSNIKKRKLNMFSLSRYFRYIKLILNRKVLITIILFSIISNSIVIMKNQKYEKLYDEIKEIQLIGVIVSDKIEKNYKNMYKIKVINTDISKRLKNIYLYLYTDKKIKLEYGNKVEIAGEYSNPEGVRNYGGFNYKEYLKQLQIYGIIKSNSIKIINKKSVNDFELYIYHLREKIKSGAKKYLSEDTYPIFLGLVLGDTSYIDDNIEEEFRTSNMSHILAVSGMHISFIALGCTLILNKIIGKKKTKIITIFILLFYMLITGFSPSIVRASIMGIMVLLGGLIHRKPDTWTSVSFSLLIILIYNPYLIENIGLQFSYFATIGIIILNKNILKILSNGKNNKSKIKEVISISISAQLFILPISIFHFNTFGIYFLISNILLSFVIGPTIILGFIFLIILICNFNIANAIAILINFLINLIILISKLSYLPMSKIYIRTPKILDIAIFYIIILIINFVYSVKKKKNPNTSNLRVKYLLEVIKFKYRQKKKALRNIFMILLVSVFMLTICVKIFSSYLQIHFVDVGQGDCSFIVTPNNKTILIDGGGSESKTFDVGKSTLIPYILDRGYTSIDYIIISHFDTDHVGGLLTVMEELKVGQVVISKQGENSENYKRFKEIVKEKKIKVIVVGQGDRLKIEKDLHFDILWPNNSKLISENILNNNSIVCKLYYKNFSCVFTGDIEKIAEMQILEEYKDNLKVLNSTVLKVGHHGSKTSSTQDFIEVVTPKIALIGVGENNKFGHPNGMVIKRLEDMRSKSL